MERVSAGVLAVAILGAFVQPAGPGTDGTQLKRGGAPRAPRAPRLQGPLFEPFAVTPVGLWAEAVAIGDVTGDGRNDVALVTSFSFDSGLDAYKLFVFRQQADGTLAPPVRYAIFGASGQRPETVDIGDLDDDGRNDVVVGIGGMGVGVFHQDATGGLAPVEMHATVDSTLVRIADLNGDGRLDVVGVGWATDTASVLLQQEGGTLGAPVTYAVPHGFGEDLEVGDLNQDGRTDVVVMTGWSGWPPTLPNISVLYQQPDGTLGGLAGRFIPGIVSHGIGVGDVTGDGLADVVESHGFERPFSGIAILSYGSLPGPALHPSYPTPLALEVSDADGDGRGDVFVVHGEWRALGVYRQVNGELPEEELYEIPYALHYTPHSLAVGDINGDGAPDVVIADYRNGLVVLRHVPPRRP